MAPVFLVKIPFRTFPLKYSKLYLQYIPNSPWDGVRDFVYIFYRRVKDLKSKQGKIRIKTNEMYLYYDVQSILYHLIWETVCIEING